MVPLDMHRSDETTANYIADLAIAGRDCRRKLNEVRIILKNEELTVRSDQ